MQQDVVGDFAEAAFKLNVRLSPLSVRSPLADGPPGQLS